ncbi:MAG: hypothetical protein HQL07_05235 [Nitrospirae bacterium]|nr:hypothetical protein [Magnetococcales bacterium]
MIKKAVITALLLPLWIYVSGCGGASNSGGGSGSSSTTVSGVVIDGPVTSSIVTFTDGNGKFIIAAKTGADAQYSISIPIGTSFPLHVSTSGGTDRVSEEAPAAMDSLVADASQTTANVTPMTSLVYRAVVANAGNLDKVTAPMIATAKKDVVAKFGFGIDAENSGIDPVTSAVNANTITSVIRSSEAMAETIRRAVGPNQTTVAQVLTILGEDMADGYLDGKKGGADLTHTMPTGFDASTIATTVAQQKVAVGLEVVANQLTVTKSDGSELSLADSKTQLSRAVNRVVSTVSASTALDKMNQMPLSENQVTQVTTDINDAIKVHGILGESTSALTALGTAAKNLKAGQAGIDRIDTLVASTATSTVDTVTSNVKNSTYATSVLSSAVATVGPPGTVTVSGIVVDGPVVGATVTIRDNTDGTVLGTAVTGADARYVLIIPAGSSFPLHLSSSGGTDKVSGATAAQMDSYVIDANQTTANITPLTTVLYHAAVNAVGGLRYMTATSVSQVKTEMMAQFGFGIDAQEVELDPVTSPIRSGNVVSVVRSAEAMGETMRRAVGSSATAVTRALAVIGADMSDGTLDGLKNGVTIAETLETGLSAVDLSIVVTQHKAIVGVEAANNSLKVTQSDSTQVTASNVLTKLSLASHTLEPSVAQATAATSMAALLISTKQKAQLTADLTDALTYQTSQGATTTALTALQTATDSMVSGQTGAGVVSTTVIDTAASATKTITDGIKNGTSSAVMVISDVYQPVSQRVGSDHCSGDCV